jgi:hypothetical protein
MTAFSEALQLEYNSNMDDFQLNKINIFHSENHPYFLKD